MQAQKPYLHQSAQSSRVGAGNVERLGMGGVCRHKSHIFSDQTETLRVGAGNMGKSGRCGGVRRYKGRIRFKSDVDSSGSALAGRRRERDPIEKIQMMRTDTNVLFVLVKLRLCG